MLMRECVAVSYHERRVNECGEVGIRELTFLFRLLSLSKEFWSRVDLPPSIPDDLYTQTRRHF